MLEKMFDNWMWAKPTLNNIQSMLSNAQGKKVLDVGSGRGMISKFFADNDMFVTAIDIEDLRLDELKKDYRINFIQAQAEKIPLDQNYFDYVFSCTTLQYMNHEKALSEFVRVAKNDSFVFLNENMPKNPIILVYRYVRRLRSLFHLKTKKYLSGIKGYLYPEFDFSVYGLKLLSCKEYYFISAFLLVIPQWLRRKKIYKKNFEDYFFAFDDYLLNTYPYLRRYCWFCTYLLKVEK